MATSRHIEKLPLQTQLFSSACHRYPSLRDAVVGAYRHFLCFIQEPHNGRRKCDIRRVAVDPWVREIHSSSAADFEGPNFRCDVTVSVELVEEYDEVAATMTDAGVDHVDSCGLASNKKHSMAHAEVDGAWGVFAQWVRHVAAMPVGVASPAAVNAPDKRDTPESTAPAVFSVPVGLACVDGSHWRELSMLAVLSQRASLRLSLVSDDDGRNVNASDDSVVVEFAGAAPERNHADRANSAELLTWYLTTRPRRCRRAESASEESAAAAAVSRRRRVLAMFSLEHIFFHVPARLGTAGGGGGASAAARMAGAHNVSIASDFALLLLSETIVSAATRRSGLSSTSACDHSSEYHLCALSNKRWPLSLSLAGPLTLSTQMALDTALATVCRWVRAASSSSPASLRMSAPSMQSTLPEARAAATVHFSLHTADFAAPCLTMWAVASAGSSPCDGSQSTDGGVEMPLLVFYERSAPDCEHGDGCDPTEPHVILPDRKRISSRLELIPFEQSFVYDAIRDSCVSRDVRVMLTIIRHRLLLSSSKYLREAVKMALLQDALLEKELGTQRLKDILRTRSRFVCLDDGTESLWPAGPRRADLGLTTAVSESAAGDRNANGRPFNIPRAAATQPPLVESRLQYTALLQRMHDATSAGATTTTASTVSGSNSRYRRTVFHLRRPITNVRPTAASTAAVLETLRQHGTQQLLSPPCADSKSNLEVEAGHHAPFLAVHQIARARGQTIKAIRGDEGDAQKTQRSSSWRSRLVCHSRVIGVMDHKFILLHCPQEANGGVASSTCRRSDAELLGCGSSLGDGCATHDYTTLVLCDQHALHERCRLEHFIAHVGSAVSSVPLDVALEVPCAWVPQTLKATTSLRTYGWAVAWASDTPRSSREDNESRLVILAVPKITLEGFVYTLGTLRLFIKAVEEIIAVGCSDEDANCNAVVGAQSGAQGGQRAPWIPSPILDVLVSRSCRGAIMFGDRIGTEDAAQLVRYGLSCVEHVFECSHGRPSFCTVNSS